MLHSWLSSEKDGKFETLIIMNSISVEHDLSRRTKVTIYTSINSKRVTQMREDEAVITFKMVGGESLVDMGFYRIYFTLIPGR